MKRTIATYYFLRGLPPHKGHDNLVVYTCAHCYVVGVVNGKGGKLRTPGEIAYVAGVSIHTKMESDHWSATLKFRGMLSNLAVKLTLEEGKSLAFIYEENIDIDKCIEVMDRITKRRRIVRGHREDLEHLKMSLDNVGRSDLKTVVDEYIKLHHCQQPLLEPVTTTHHGAHVHMVTESDMSRSKLSGLGVR